MANRWHCGKEVKNKLLEFHDSRIRIVFFQHILIKFLVIFNEMNFWCRRWKVLFISYLGIRSRKCVVLPGHCLLSDWRFFYNFYYFSVFFVSFYTFCIIYSVLKCYNCPVSTVLLAYISSRNVHHVRCSFLMIISYVYTC